MSPLRKQGSTVQKLDSCSFDLAQDKFCRNDKCCFHNRYKLLRNIPKLVPIFRDSLEAATHQIRCYKVLIEDII